MNVIFVRKFIIFPVNEGGQGTPWKLESGNVWWKVLWESR